MNWLLISVLIGQATVIDGDTIRVDKLKVRLWGLDAPEMNTDGGVRAKEAMVHLIEGKEVSCEPDGTVSYDRVVAKCFVGGRDIASFVIEAGVAKPYCKFSGEYYNEAAKKGGVNGC